MYKFILLLMTLVTFSISAKAHKFSRTIELPEHQLILKIYGELSSLNDPSLTGVIEFKDLNGNSISEMNSNIFYYWIAGITNSINIPMGPSNKS